MSTATSVSLPRSAVPGPGVPLMDRWGVGTRRIDRRERRDHSRRPLEADVWLIDLPGRSVLRCKTDDVCDAGLHASAPIGYGLAIGQRYEVRMTDTAALRPSCQSLGQSLGYATVIRTEIHLENRGHDRLGFAVRFDAPQLLPV